MQLEKVVGTNFICSNILSFEVSAVFAYLVIILSELLNITVLILTSLMVYVSI